MKQNLTSFRSSDHYLENGGNFRFAVRTSRSIALIPNHAIEAGHYVTAWLVQAANWRHAAYKAHGAQTFVTAATGALVLFLLVIMAVLKWLVRVSCGKAQQYT